MEKNNVKTYSWKFFISYRQPQNGNYLGNLIFQIIILFYHVLPEPKFSCLTRDLPHWLFELDGF